MDRTAEPLRPSALRNRSNRKDSRSRSPLKRVRWQAGIEVEGGRDEGQRAPQHARDRVDSHQVDASRASRAPTPPRTSVVLAQSPKSSVTLKPGPGVAEGPAAETAADPRPWFTKLREKQKAKKAALKATMGTRPKALAKSAAVVAPVEPPKEKGHQKKGNDKGKAKGKGKGQTKKGGKTK